MKLNARQLRDAHEHALRQKASTIPRNPLYFILENIYDTYNIGGIFRLADALAVKKVYLCGATETPPNSRIQKSSIGTYKVVPWEYKETAGEAIRELKSIKGADNKKMKSESQLSTFIPYPLPTTYYPPPTIIAVEQDARSVDYRHIAYQGPVALVLGNETFGMLKETLDMCDAIAEIPMWGVNTSLNVIVSAGIVGYYAVRKLGI